MHKPRFQPDSGLWSDGAAALAGSEDDKLRDAPPNIPSGDSSAAVVSEQAAEALTDGPQTRSAGEESSWRDEVASRVSSYRAKRRPHKPRFPSLSLKFDGPAASFPSSATRDSVLPTQDDELGSSEPPAVVYPRLNDRAETGRLIQFPRLASLTSSGSELADPVTDIPRILEAPELTPPPPALGGILIESPQSQTQEKRPGIEVPLQLASMSRRIAASLIDVAIVLLAFGLFGAIFYRITAAIPDPREVLESGVPVLAILWFGYQYLSLVHTGTTPGLRLAKLHLNCFDGNTVPTRKRRWRVFASVLSLASLGLGYLWSLIDEDQLCWHDRVTCTHIAPAGKP